MRIKKKRLKRMLENERTRGFTEGFDAGMQYAIDNESAARLGVAISQLKKSVIDAGKAIMGENKN